MAGEDLGTLQDRVTIQSQSVTTDSHGGQIVTWGDLATVWARVSPWETQQDETVRLEKVTATNRYRIELRYRGDVTPTMRLLWTPYLGSQKTLNIYGVVPAAREGRRLLRLDCVEVV